MNAKHKRWQCPICNRRSLNIYKDMFYQEVLSSHAKIQEADYTVEDKFCIDAQIGLIVMRNKGKNKDRYRMVEQDQVCNGFALQTRDWNENMTTATAASSSAVAGQTGSSADQP